MSLTLTDKTFDLGVASTNDEISRLWDTEDVCLYVKIFIDFVLHIVFYFRVVVHFFLYFVVQYSFKRSNRNIRTIVAYCLDVYMYIRKVFLYTCNGEVFLLVRKDMDVNEHERIFRVRVMVSYATFKNISAISFLALHVLLFCITQSL